MSNKQKTIKNKLFDGVVHSGEPIKNGYQVVQFKVDPSEGKEVLFFEKPAFFVKALGQSRAYRREADLPPCNLILGESDWKKMTNDPNRGLPFATLVLKAMDKGANIPSLTLSIPMQDGICHHIDALSFDAKGAVTQEPLDFTASYVLKPTQEIPRAAGVSFP